VNMDNRIQVSGIDIEWKLEDGRCTFEKLPVVMIWVDTSLAGLFSGVQAMVGTPRYLLALQSEGRKSVEEDWKVLSQFPDFHDGFKAMANIAAVAGWGEWHLVSLHPEKRECCFRIKHAWEGAYQKALGVCWGSGFLAGKMAGYCTKLFGTNCWADQTAFIAGGDPYDEFVVKPSTRSIELEMENLLATDEATRADMAVALRRLEKEIAERKRTEGMLRESEKRYRAIFEGAVEGILIARLDTKSFIYANPAVCRMFGYSADEITALSVGDVHPPDALRGILRDFEGQSHGRKQVVVNAPCLRKDASLFYADIVFGRIVIDGVECNLGFFTDITERKRAENALQKAHKLESLGVLAGGIAHDFNNLLMGVFANIDMARSRCDPDEEAIAFLDEAMKVAARAADLTKQLLTFSKGGAPTRRTGHLAEMAKETARFTLSGSNISCDFDIPEDLWLCSFDENQMAQVVQNIVLNAQQAMPMGGSIRIGAANLSLQGGEHPSLGEGEFVRLSIQDSGVGIPQEMLQKIFDPFFTTRPKGSGLGLATAYSIMAKHEGHIDAESEYGKGSSFHIFLPAARKDSASLKAAEETVRRRSGRILIMDDQDFVRTVVGKMLTDMGCTVVDARDGQEALRLFTEAHDSPDPFRAVILDLTIPGGMGGKETVREFRKVDPAMTVIASSGYSEDPIMSNPEKFGFNASIRKPYTERELAKLLNALLGESK